MIIRLTQPALEPITLADARAHLRVTDTDEDVLIEAFISAAREYAENYCGRSFAEASYALRMEAFPSGTIRVPPDVSAVSEITYTDAAGATVTLSSGSYSLDAELCEITAEAWPTGSTVRVEFIAGPALVPPTVVAAIKLTIGDLFENRQAGVVGAAHFDNPGRDNLLQFHRVSYGV